MGDMSVRHHADFPRGWWRCVRGAVSALGLLLALTACGANTTATRASHDGQQETAINILDPNTVDDLLSSIAHVGLPVPNPRHVTERDCPDIGCTDKVDTDT